MLANLIIPFNFHCCSSWLLESNESKQLQDMIAILPGRMYGWDEMSYMAYRGIMIFIDSDRLKVYKEILKVESSNEVRFFNDKNRRLEKWLFKTSSTKIDEDIYQQINERELSDDY